MSSRCATHTHRGNENSAYYPERKKRVIWKENPYGYRCQWCGKVIKWVYRGKEPWKAPRFYCDNHVCQGVRETRARLTDFEGVVHNPNVRKTLG